MTLRWREQDDLSLAVQHLRDLGTVSTIGLWGRSMGAVTALLYSQKDPSIAGVVSQADVHVHRVSAMHIMSAKSPTFSSNRNVSGSVLAAYACSQIAV